MDREGVGGFLESILAVMVVITVSSVFLVVLASGTVHMEEMDQEEVISWMISKGLYLEDGAISLDGPGEGPILPGLPEDISGMTIVYRSSGNSTPLMVLNQGQPSSGNVLAFQRPLLIELNGSRFSGVMEVKVWR
ncbi:MAG TPA: hypothetical protein P5202_01815 [Methanomassiliicoccales archaeon]|nr:hypothetical protein [Methanomassiliicoccales archaeon]